MALISMLSLGASPGVTTAAVGMVMNWPCPIILLEADVSKPSSVVPGYLRAQVDTSRSLVNLAVAQARETFTDSALWSQLVPLAQDLHTPEAANTQRWLLAGIPNPVAAQGMRSLWQELPGVLRSVQSTGTDLVLDLGRVAPGDRRAALLESSDVVVVVTGNTLPALSATRSMLPAIHALLAQTGKAEALRLLSIGHSTAGYRPREIATHLTAPVLGELPWDPRAAAVFSHGTPAPSGWKRTPLPGALRAMAVQLHSTAVSAAAQLETATVPDEQQESP